MARRLPQLEVNHWIAYEHGKVWFALILAERHWLAFLDCERHEFPGC